MLGAAITAKISFPFKSGPGPAMAALRQYSLTLHHELVLLSFFFSFPPFLLLLFVSLITPSFSSPLPLFFFSSLSSSSFPLLSFLISFLEREEHLCGHRDGRRSHHWIRIRRQSIKNKHSKKWPSFFGCYQNGRLSLGHYWKEGTWSLFPSLFAVIIKMIII